MSVLYTAINLTLGPYLQVEFLYYISRTPISLYLEWIYIYMALVCVLSPRKFYTEKNNSHLDTGIQKSQWLLDINPYIS